MFFPRGVTFLQGTFFSKLGVKPTKGSHVSQHSSAPSPQTMFTQAWFKELRIPQISQTGLPVWNKTTLFPPTCVVLLLTFSRRSKNKSGARKTTNEMKKKRTPKQTTLGRMCGFYWRSVCSTRTEASSTTGNTWKKVQHFIFFAFKLTEWDKDKGLNQRNTEIWVYLHLHAVLIRTFRAKPFLFCGESWRITHKNLI